MTILVLAALSQVSDHSSAQTNQPPVAVPDTFNVHGYVVTPVGANVLTNDSDPNGDTIVANYQSLIYVSGVGAFGVGSNGVPFASGGPTPGTATIGYSITDNRGGQASSTITFNVQNAAPTAVTDFYEVVSETFTTGPLGTIISNDFDSDGDAVNTFLQSNTTLPNGAGIYSISQAGVLSVSRNPSVSGTVVIGYPIADSLGANSWGSIVLVLQPIDGASDAGKFCPSRGAPVNVASGNMWIEHSDYALPGSGENIQIDRFYNSVIQSSGLFGLGWSTQYDESVWAYGDKLLRLNMPDGRAVYFARTNTTSPFDPLKADVQGQIVKNPDNTYTLALKDGRVHDFSSVGRLIRQTDRNGNQTTLTYNVNNALIGVTDSVGRTLTLRRTATAPSHRSAMRWAWSPITNIIRRLPASKP